MRPSGTCGTARSPARHEGGFGAERGGGGAATHPHRFAMTHAKDAAPPPGAHAAAKGRDESWLAAGRPGADHGRTPGTCGPEQPRGAASARFPARPGKARAPAPYRDRTVPYLLPAAGRARAGEQRRLLADYGRVLHEDAVGEALVSRQLQHLQPQLAP